jgi:hypothetical protein
VGCAPTRFRIENFKFFFLILIKKRKFELDFPDIVPINDPLFFCLPRSPIRKKKFNSAFAAAPPKKKGTYISGARRRTTSYSSITPSFSISRRRNHKYLCVSVCLKRITSLIGYHESRGSILGFYCAKKD